MIPVLCVLGGLLLFLAAALLYVYRTAFHVSARQRSRSASLPDDAAYGKAKERVRALQKEMPALPCEEVSVRSHDGLTLFGRYYHVADGAPVHIMFHGYRSSGLRDMCGGSKLIRKLGHNTLVVDQRAHGKSEGHNITFGVKERFDCLAWIRYVGDRFGTDTPVFLTGLSMGAATVLMASELALPPSVRGILADCPYSSPRAILLKVSGDMGFPNRLAAPFLRLSARILAGFSLDSASPVEAVRHAKVPILLLHGDADGFVPHEMSVEIHRACSGSVTFVSVPGADHGLCYMQDPARYEETVKAFLARCLA